MPVETKKEIKFRQPIFIDGKFDRFHYWGYVIDEGKLCFVGPMHPTGSVKKDSQQYIGLKNAKGKEIYEGDLCKFEGEIYLVEFTECRTAFTKGGKAIDVFYICAYNRDKDIEIIGNKSANPELLKEAK